MFRFIARRLTFIFFVAVLIVYAIYLGMGLRQNSEVSQPSYNLVQPSQRAWEQTKSFFSEAGQGDFGVVTTNAGILPIRDFLQEAYLNSLGLLLVSLAAATFLGLLLGVRASLKKQGKSPLATLTLTVVGISIPSFFLGLLLQQGVIRYQQNFGRRLASVAGIGWDWRHMLLPVIVLSARPLAYLTRTTFLSFNEVMRQDYIRTATAKGLRRGIIVARHAFRNLAIPLLTAVGVSLRFSLGTLPIVEFFFAWPGLGFRALEAIRTQQADLIAAVALAFGLTFLLINFALDISYRFIDPRLREGEDS